MCMELGNQSKSETGTGTENCCGELQNKGMVLEAYRCVKCPDKGLFLQIHSM